MILVCVSLSLSRARFLFSMFHVYESRGSTFQKHASPNGKEKSNDRK